MSGVVYVFQDHYPWDIRAEKFLNALSSNGNSTSIVSRNRTGESVQEELDGFTIRRLPRGWGPVTRHLLNFPAFFSPIWINAIVRAVRVQNADLIIVRDLPLGPAAYWAGKQAGVPVVMDMAEDYPAMTSALWEYGGRAPFDVLVRNPSLLRKLEHWILPKMDGVIGVSEASAVRVRALVDTAKTRVGVVGNTPRIDKHMAGEESAVAEKVRGITGLKLLYVGWVTAARGLSTVVQALPEIQRRVGKVTLVVIGDGTGLEGLRQEAEQAGLSDSVYLAGWLDQKYVPNVIAAADVCLVPHYVCAHIETTLPNKIYDYMLHSKPVVVTHSISLREFVEGNQCGLWYHDKDPQELAKVISQLAAREVAQHYGRNGYEAVQSKLNWAADADVLNDFVATMLEHGPPD